MKIGGKARRFPAGRCRLPDLTHFQEEANAFVVAFFVRVKRGSFYNCLYDYAGGRVAHILYVAHQPLQSCSRPGLPKGKGGRRDHSAWGTVTMMLQAVALLYSTLLVVARFPDLVRRGHVHVGDTCKVILRA